MTLPYLIWLDDVQQPVTADMLYVLDHDDLVMACTLSRSRDGLPHMSIELENPGWSVWETGQPRACALVEAEHGAMLSWKVRARGIVRTLPPAVSGETLTLDVECSLDSDALIRAKEIAAAAVLGVAVPSEYDEDGTLADDDPTAEQLPYLDRLFGRLEYLADAVGQTRHGYWHYDPVTHAVAWRDHAASRGVWNLADAYDAASLQVVPGKGAVREVRAKLVCQLQVNATGTCDIGSWIGPVVSLTGFSGQAEGSLAANVGWNLGSPIVTPVVGQTAPIETGRVWRGAFRRISYLQVLVNGTPRTDTFYGPTFEYESIAQYVRLRTVTSVMTAWPVTYQWNQSIRETARITLRMPVQPGASAVVDYLDLGTISISDPHGIEGFAELAEHEEGREYNEGDVVLKGGQAYRASVDGLTSFWLVKTVIRKTVYERDPRWVDTGFAPALDDPAATEFFERPRGQACIAGMILRMRVAGLDRFQDWQVTVTCLREDLLALGPALDLDCEVRILLPGRQGTPDLKPVRGRVMSIEEVWHGDQGETVNLTLAIPPGTGVDLAARLAATGSYGASDYADAEFIEQDTTYLTAGDDIEWTWEADPLSLPVDPKLLSEPGYALRQYQKRGQIDEQLAAFKRAAALGQEDPVAAAGKVATTVDVELVPLVTTKVIDREYRVTADLTRSPRGIRLTEEGEP
ncbi:hypothetical protein ASF49_08065 [Methylobacterium sp. Leaf104]|uniref:hypothetical protein n=1 Tax=Methylobacterium TaxID=407 RepID=UPI0006FC4804|nr:MULTISPECIES: hypothetical protein [Methylobacterium]KQP33812.1 hypothetical protein ASF49_08065 [Methylobacterium sp. Leaf104]MCI9879620.1 hypothetical protein [Methylobacterium goesingense]